MAFKSSSSFCYFCILFSLVGLASASGLIPDHVFEIESIEGRQLKQNRKKCSVDFAAQDYTPLTSRCKGPQYHAKKCCVGFKIVTCPWFDIITDPSTDCATSLVRNIQFAGNYPASLFKVKCQGPTAVNCTGSKSAPSAGNSPPGPGSKSKSAPPTARNSPPGPGSKSKSAPPTAGNSPPGAGSKSKSAPPTGIKSPTPAGSGSQYLPPFRSKTLPPVMIDINANL